MTPAAQPASQPPARSPAATIFVAGVLGLFLELALIRWVSCEIRVFAYCKNLVLIASFLGFGAGCFLAGRKLELVRGSFALLLLAMLVRLPWQFLQDYGPQRVTSVLAELSGMMIFHMTETSLPWSALAKLAFASGWSAVLFFAIALVIVPYGQLTARAIGEVGAPLRGYSLNVAGSLTGILAYTAATYAGLPPACWFVPASVASLWFVRDPAERSTLFATTIALLLVLLPNDTPTRLEYWSTYQKLALVKEQEIIVNNVGYQRMIEQQTHPQGPVAIDRWSLPYALRRPPGRVLIVGAGAGNDAAAALGAGASSVTAVEIDAKIYDIGRRLHPQKPYDDPRMRVVIDDARHFLKTTEERFDVIVFSHLDSHTLLSSFTNVRLDDYIYTVESFREARSRLAPEGMVYVSFFAELPFIGPRLDRNLTEAFGHRPLALEGEWGRGWKNVYFMTGEPAVMTSTIAVATNFPGFVHADATDIVPSTDAWPFLPLERPRVPPIMLVISLVILSLSVVFALRVRPAGERFDGRLFWLGAAFMLLEVHNVSRLALVFGTTWKVNAWVIGVILGLILVANALRSARPSLPASSAAAGLFASLAAAYLVPLGTLAAWPGLIGGLAATVLLCLPIFFAGLVFADAFAESRAPGFALGWNVLGAVAGGMAENVSYLFGIPALVPLAAVFYATALLWPRAPSPATPA